MPAQSASHGICRLRLRLASFRRFSPADQIAIVLMDFVISIHWSVRVALRQAVVAPHIDNERVASLNQSDGHLTEQTPSCG